jgi:Family of unknown function (DUF5924)/Protein of unknown function (DUF2914)
MSALPQDPQDSATKWQTRWAMAEVLLNRVPWLIPASSFAAGWIGFVMVKRGAGAARWIAMLALMGLFWLLIEPLVRQRLERRKARMGNFVVNFVSQSLQQELLFFSLPLIIGATQLDIGQIVFTTIAAATAVISTIDPLYERYVATRAVRRLAFHGYCSWIAALVVLPMVLRLPLERALPLSLVAMAGWWVLTLPLSLASLRGPRQKAAWIVTLLLLPLLLWVLRSNVPAAGLAVTGARITQSIEELTPGAAVNTVRSADLVQGMIAYAAIRAPTGLAQSVIFQWRHGSDSEAIVEEIRGGNEGGWRTYSRKQSFPADARGRWTVDILTPQGQLLKRLRFFVN